MDRAVKKDGDDREYVVRISVEKRLPPGVLVEITMSVRDTGEVEYLAVPSRHDIASVARAGLTARETEVLSLLGAGLSNQNIARRLFISERTVKNYVSSLLAKLNLANRAQLALFAFKGGYAGQAES